MNLSKVSSGNFREQEQRSRMWKRRTLATILAKQVGKVGANQKKSKLVAKQRQKHEMGELRELRRRSVQL